MRVEVHFEADGSYAIMDEERTIAPGPAPLPEPPILFLGSLAACAGIFAVEFLRTRHFEFAGLKVIAMATHAENPRHLDNIVVRVVIPHPVDDRYIAPLRRAVDLCTLKNTLTKPPRVLSVAMV